MRKILASALVCVFLGISSLAFGGTSLAKVQSKRVGNEFVAELAFSKAVPGQDIAVEFSQESIDVVVPNITTRRPNNIFAVQDEMIKNISVSRAGKDIRIRMKLYAGQSATAFKDTTRIESNGKKVTISIAAPGAAVSRMPVANQATGKMIDELMNPPAEKAAATDLEKDLLNMTASKVQPVASEVKGDAKIEKIPVVDTKALEGKGGAEAKATETKTNAHADEESRAVFENKPAVKAPAPSQNMGTKAGLSLAVILTLIGAASWIYKKWPVRATSGKPHMIRVLSQSHLGPKKSLAVVRVAGETVLIGVTDANISLLKSLALLDEEVPEGPGPMKFQEALKKQVASQKPERPEAESQGQEPADILSAGIEDDFSMRGIQTMIGERLKGMKNI